MSDRKKRGGSRGTVTWGADDISSPPPRRSLRTSSSFNKSSDSPMPAPVIKRSITAKKIMPRKTLAALASAESQPKAVSMVEQPSPCPSSGRPNTVIAASQSTPIVASVVAAPRRSSRAALASAESQPKAASMVEQPSPCASSARSNTVIAASQSTPIVASVVAAPRRSSRISPNAGKENPVLHKSHDSAKDVTNQSATSKIDVLSPIPLNIPQSPNHEDRQRVMSQKVRRSYSRLEMSLNSSSFLYSPTKKTSESSDTSTPNLSKSGRKSLFGFDKLLSSEEEVENKKVGEKMKQTFNESSNGSSARLLVEEPDHNIPGVVLTKQKRRKRKVPQIEVSTLDEWAAAMNAEFDEAEKFDLLVE
ncbi:sororin [Dendropsophus ebraccatus]|uniref:sororin n=1 Tax=Dendropsophus ebraccatus TaxID=150705 RepID=UPI003831A20C